MVEDNKLNNFWDTTEGHKWISANYDQIPQLTNAKLEKMNLYKSKAEGYTFVEQKEKPNEQELQQTVEIVPEIANEQ